MFQLRNVRRGGGGASASNANLPIFGDAGAQLEFLNGLGGGRLLAGVNGNYNPLEPPLGTPVGNAEDDSSEKDYILEKLLSMDQRLVIVERFIDAKFCETFQDFSLRSSFYDNDSRRRRAGGGRRDSRGRKGRRSRNHRRSHKRPRYSDESSDDDSSSSDGDDQRHQNRTRTGTSTSKRHEGYTNGAKKGGTKHRNVMLQRRVSGNGHSQDYLQTPGGQHVPSQGQPKQPRSGDLIQIQRGQGQADGQGHRQVQQSNSPPSTLQNQTASIVAIPLPAPAPPQPLPVNLHQSTSASTSATSSISSLDFNSQQTSNKTTDNDVITIPDLNLLRKGKNARGQGQGHPEMPSASTSTSTSLTLAPEYYNSSSSCNNSDLNVHLNGYLDTAIDNMTTGTPNSQVSAPPPSGANNATIPVPPGDVDLGVTIQETESRTGIEFGSGGEQKLLAGSEVNMDILEGQASEPDVNVEHALAIADAMQMQDFQSDPLDPGQDQCQGQSQEGHYVNADFHPQQQQQSSMLLMTTPTTATTSSGIKGAIKSDSPTQNSRNDEESLIDIDHDHAHVPESILPATPSPPPSPTKNPLQNLDDDDDDDDDDDEDEEVEEEADDDTGCHSTTTPSGSAEMPSEEYLKRIGYRRRLHICPYCKSPCKINNRFRHLRNHCQVTPAQLRYEESKKGSVEHWPKATLVDYQNFYKNEKEFIEMESPTSKVATTATVEVEVVKRRSTSTIRLSQGQGQVSVKTDENEIKNAAVEAPASRGRGRPKGTFKLFTCSYCGKKMHRIALRRHVKKCGNNESDTVDDDDSDEDYDVEEDNMKLATSGKRSSSTSRNSVAASVSPAEKIGQCDRCLRFMLARSIPRHKREACKGKDDGDSSVSSSNVKGQSKGQRRFKKDEDEEEVDMSDEDNEDDDEEEETEKMDFENDDDAAMESDATSASGPFDPASRACSYEDCKFVPETYQDYERHLLEHPLDIARSCYVCPKIFIHEGNLQKHLEMHTAFNARDLELHL